MELADDRALVELTCPSCGHNFGIAGDESLAYQTQGGTLRRRTAFGRFELLEELGSGAFGAVWKARDTQLGRIVALKLPRHGQLTLEEMERFFREARAAAQTRHPSIVPVHEVGIQDETVFIVSEFVDGLSLKDWLSAHECTPQEAAEMVFLISEAIHHVHERDVIHRDLKPANILLDKSNRPHVSDFGLAKREQGEVTLTADGLVMGTMHYMSPEQARGRGHYVDRRADVYSLGVILFQLLTGELPFRGTYRMVLKQVLEDEPPRLRKLKKSIPRDLETVCLKCLEKDPANRYTTAQDLADDLQRHLRGEPIVARPVGRVERGWRWCRRNPAVAGWSLALLAALSFCLPAIGLLAARMNRRPEANEPVMAAGGAAHAVAATTPATPPPAAPTGDADADEIVPEAGQVGTLQERGSRSTQPRPLPTFVNSIGMELTLIPAGAFVMGSTVSAQEIDRRFPGGKVEWYTNEHPRHMVQLTRPFYLGRHEVTVADFRRFVTATGHKTTAEKEGNVWGCKGGRWVVVAGSNWETPGFEQQDTHPVTCVSWYDAVAFCRWLTDVDRRPYRLPTEAEWEYACRAGTDTIFFWGDNPDGGAGYMNGAGTDAPSDGRTWNPELRFKDGYTSTSPAGRFQPNQFGLSDMLGNVAEWCVDVYASDYYFGSPLQDPSGPAAGSYRVYRGGSWFDGVLYCRPARRHAGTPGYRTYNLGFRVASSSVDASSQQRQTRQERSL